MSADLEGKCLKWLLDNSEDILKSNDCLDEVLSDLSKIHGELIKFTSSMREYMQPIIDVHSETVRLTYEKDETSDIVKRLEDYVATIIITPEAERALTCTDIEIATEDNFWTHLAELHQKFNFVTKLLDQPVDTLLKDKYEIAEQEQCPEEAEVEGKVKRLDDFVSLIDARAKLADLESIVRHRLRNYVHQQVVKSFNPSAPLAGARHRFHSLAKHAFDTLSEQGAHHLCQDILTKYVSTVSALHYNQVCEYFHVIRTQVPKAEYSENDLRRGLMALGFQMMQSPLFDRGTSPGIITGGGNAGSNGGRTAGSHLVSMLINTVMPSQPISASMDVRRDTIPSAESNNGRMNSLFGTISEVRQRFEVLKDVRKPAFPLQHYQKTGQIAYAEELLRSIFLAILDIGQQEMNFITEFFFTQNNEQPSTLLSLSSASEAPERSANSNSETWTLPTKHPITKVFDRVFLSSLIQARKDINQIFVVPNYDLVSLVIMRRMIKLFQDACAKESIVFMDNLLLNLGNELDKHINSLVDTLRSTIMNNSKPPPKSQSEMFARRGINEIDFPNSSTVQTLLEALMVCALGGMISKSETIKADLIGLYDDVTLGSSMSGRMLRVYEDVSYIIWVVSEFKGEESHSSESLEILQLTESWASGYRVKLTECLAIDLINRVRPEYQDTIKAGEAQLSTFGEIKDATQIKLAKFTSTDFKDDLRKLSEALLPLSQEVTSRAVSFGDHSTSYEIYKSQLRKDVMTKYAILYSRYTKVLSQTKVNMDRLPSPEDLILETKSLLEPQQADN